MLREPMVDVATQSATLLRDLQARGLFHQCTHLEGLEKHLAQPRKVYAGFDPTKDSLTIGNLVSILLLRRFQLAGHQPVVLMGGGTGLIGDPSGKDAERSLNTVETVQKNIAGQRELFSSILDFEWMFNGSLIDFYCLMEFNF